MTKTSAISTTSPRRSRTATSCRSFRLSPEDDMAEEAEREVPDGAAVFPVIPEELGVDPLLLAVLHATVFLDGSEKDIVNPAAARETMEYLIDYLRRLKGTRLRQAREDFACLAAYA